MSIVPVIKFGICHYNEKILFHIKLGFELLQKHYGESNIRTNGSRVGITTTSNNTMHTVQQLQIMPCTQCVPSN